MKIVYECEFCDETSEDKEKILLHEKSCGSNPKNKIKDETVLKLSRIQEHFIDSLIYVLLNDFTEERLEFYNEEFVRATRTNCSASIYENKEALKNVFIDVRHFRHNETKYFKDITSRDNPELIDAIRTYLREPEYRIKSNGDKK